ncbi:MAG: hypothetical protein U0L09_08145, partial [Christensenellales bacterium]|nr:hypothetical protein [Christensenellales bacterium]
MAKRKEIPPVYQEPEVTGGAPKLIAAVVLYGLALLMGYIVLAVPEAGTAMGSVRSVLTGLCGSLAIMVPAMLVWGGTLLTLSWKEKPVSAWRTVLDGLLFLFLLTAVQLFYVEIIIRDRMTIHSFANFVDKSYGYGFGGGALGALLAWFLYQFMGCTGGFLGVLFLAVISLTATGKAGRFIRWCRQTAQNARHRSEQRFMEEKNEQMFDFVDRPQRSVPRRRMPPPPQRAERFRQEEERYQEPSRQESGRAMARRREAPHREPPARTPRRGEHLDSMYIPDGDRRYVRERTERRDTEEARVEMLERPTGAPKRRVKIQGSETTQLYEEPLDSRAKASAKIPAEEDLFDVRNTAQAPRRPLRSEFKPDTSAAAEELRKIKASDNQISMEE